MNLVTAEGDVWRKHRRIMGPAFNNKVSVVIFFILQIDIDCVHFRW